jgi:DNA-binding response OmpR family regulator
MKTLVVEDDLKSQCLLTKVLSERGHEVTTFENAEQAILAYEKEFYPLLLVDAGLPGMGGLQFCRWIRSRPDGERIFVIVATEPDHPADITQVIEAGANDFLSKPYEVNGLRARLTIAEKQMQRFFEQVQLAEALENETRRWSQSEARLAELRTDLATQTRQRDDELTRLREQVRAETLRREHAETALQGAVAAARRQSVDELDQLQQQWQARCQELERESMRLEEKLRSAADTQRQLEDALEHARNQEAVPSGADPAEAAQLREALAAQQAENQRLSAALQEARAELEIRSKSVTEQLAAAEQTARTERDQRETLAAELQSARSELAACVKEHTRELLALSQDVKAHLDDRKQVDAELAAAREELTRHTRENLVEMVRVRDDFKGLLEERQRLLDQLEQARHQQVVDLHHRDQQTAELQDRLRRETVERQRLADALTTRDATLRRLQDELRTHREARKRLEHRWRVLSRLGPELTQAGSPEQVARAMARLAQDLVGWDIFSYDAYAVAGDWIHPILHLENTDGEPKEVAAYHPGPQPTSLMRRVLEDGPQLVLRPSPSCSQTDLVVLGDRARHSASLLYVPVKVGSRVIGFLSVRSGRLDAYDGDDLEDLMALGAFAAGALERFQTEAQPDQADTDSAGEPLPTLAAKS